MVETLSGAKTKGGDTSLILFKDYIMKRVNEARANVARAKEELKRAEEVLADLVGTKAILFDAFVIMVVSSEDRVSFEPRFIDPNRKNRVAIVAVDRPTRIVDEHKPNCLGFLRNFYNDPKIVDVQFKIN